MAINIFQNGGGKSKAKVNQASNSTRAQQAKSALAAPSETSSSGNVAVKSGGTLSKIGGFIGKAAGVASKFLPGVGGAVSKGLANLFNDPEWWQSVPGNALTLNAPLIAFQSLGRSEKTALDTPASYYQERVAIGEFVSISDSNAENGTAVIEPTVNMITQYLMPEIRKVVNAIPLQGASSYRTVIAVNATVYALWRNLKKYDYFLKHGTTYIPNTNDKAFPILQVENASWLQSTINRLEEYLRANVRLPHTMCEYLAWRFGRIYKSNNSAKSAIILYNVLPMTTAIEAYNSLISRLFSAISASPAVQMANTDVYNAYFDHDYMVEIQDSTQFVYDLKEFMLRTNLDIAPKASGATVINTPLNPVVIDSAMDNPTTFMASTVSTLGVDASSDGTAVQLVHCTAAFCYEFCNGKTLYCGEFNGDRIIWLKPINALDTKWGVTELKSQYVSYPGDSTFDITKSYFNAMKQLQICKALDIYNKEILIALAIKDENVAGWFDLTTLSIDMGTVEDAVIGIEQTYAFANMVDIDRKTSMSYAKAEKLVARDTANLIDSLDVAATASTK